MRTLKLTALAAAVVLVNAAYGEAQTWTFRTEPYCNKVTITVVPANSDSVFGIIGYDDNCGQSPRSPIYGTLIVERDGSFTFGYTFSMPYSVYGRTDVAMQVSVEWPATADVGTWLDDEGETGDFVFDILDQKSGDRKPY
jgi:hypothetical protein